MLYSCTHNGNSGRQRVNSSVSRILSSVAFWLGLDCLHGYWTLVELSGPWPLFVSLISSFSIVLLLVIQYVQGHEFVNDRCATPRPSVISKDVEQLQLVTAATTTGRNSLNVSTDTAGRHGGRLTRCCPCCKRPVKV